MTARVKRTLLWDAGPGETRAALVENGTVIEFHIIRPRRSKPLLIDGERFTARIVSKFGGNQAIVDLGGAEALLTHAPPMPEGAQLVVEIVRAAIPEPGRWKRATVRAVTDEPPRGDRGWHGSDEPDTLFLRRMAPLVDMIVCPSNAVANAVAAVFGSVAPPVSVDPLAIADADFDALIERAVGGEWSIDGGTLHIERTRAMVMIDVDGSAAPLALNLAAARAIPPLLRLLDIGGPVGIDFVSMGSKAERVQVSATLADAAADLGGYEATAINGYGFCQIIRPRVRASIPEILCGIIPGQLSSESLAIALLRVAARSIGHGPRRIVAPPAITDVISGWPGEIASLAALLGVTIELVPDPQATGYGHVHVTPA